MKPDIRLGAAAGGEPVPDEMLAGLDCLAGPVPAVPHR